MLALTGIGLLRTQAAVAIRTDAECSLTVSVIDSDEVYKQDFNDPKMEILVDVYRVASVDASGRYTSLAPFEELKFQDINSETTAQMWEELAAEAKGILEKNSGLESDGSTLVRREADSPVDVVAQGTIEGLATGMYLVVPQNAYNADYTYEYMFQPYLTALPGNAYATLDEYGYGQVAPTDPEDPDAPAADEWNYDPVIGLKAGRQQLLGELRIEKTLANYNETLGRTSFVFQMEGRNDAGEIVYSEVISTTHDGPGTETVTLGGIPAGITVTVTEVYSGASYTVDGSGVAEAVIRSGEAVANLEGVRTATVSFTNRYNGGNRGGNGVTNRFDSDGEGGWTWVNPQTQE